MLNDLPKFDAIEYRSSFHPRRYLEEYYATDEIGNEDQAIASRATEWLSKHNHRFESMIDVGSGPVIEYPFLFADRVEHLDFADYLPGNLAEIRKWLTGDTDAFNWDGMLGSMLRHLTGSAGDLARKKQRLRTVSRDLLHVDLCRPSILDVDRKYDLVTSFHCAECVARDREDWKAMFQKILGLAKPGGSFFFSIMKNAVRYQILGKWFPVTPLDESALLQRLKELGIDDYEITTHACPEFADSGFSEVLLVSGQLLEPTEMLR